MIPNNQSWLPPAEREKWTQFAEILEMELVVANARIAALEAERDRWVLRLINPPRGGWYYVHNRNDGSVSSRYYDDSDETWWHSTAADGWTPNDAFIDWLWVREIHGKELEAERDSLKKALRIVVGAIKPKSGMRLETGDKDVDSVLNATLAAGKEGES